MKSSFGQEIKALMKVKPNMEGPFFNFMEDSQNSSLVIWNGDQLYLG